MHLKNQLKSIERDLEKETTMRIAFTGSHSTGKTTAAEILRKQIEKVYPDSTINSLGSVTRSISDWGGIFRDGRRIRVEKETDSFQLACIYERRSWMMDEDVKNSDFIISERWALDEAGYQGFKADNTYKTTSKYYYRVAVEEAKWEATNYWNRIYYIPLSDRGVEDDGIRPLDKNYQKEIDDQIQTILMKLNESIIIKQVPLDMDELEVFFEEEVRKWKK